MLPSARPRSPDCSGRSDEIADAHRYFARLHPINGILDPVLHTPDFVRSRSALLFTWIIALTAQFDHASGSIAKRLRLHGEKLSNYVHACGFKSVEIVQGYYISLLSATPTATLAEERSWLYTMYAFGLGSELGLDQESSQSRETDVPTSSADTPPSQSHPGPHAHPHLNPQLHSHSEYAWQYHPLMQHMMSSHHNHNGDCNAATMPQPAPDPTHSQRLARNRERTWLRILLWERANSAARGRIHSFPETKLTRDIERWWQHPLADPTDKHTCAFIVLRRTLAALQREMHRQAAVPHADPHWVRDLVDTALRPWLEAWLPGHAGADAGGNDHDVNTGAPAAGEPWPSLLLPPADAYLLHVYLHGRLWTLSFALHSSISNRRHLHAIRQDCFDAAVRCCEAAVRDLMALGEPLYCMLAPTWAMIAYAGVLALSLFPALYGTRGHSEAELLALVGQVTLQLERAGTTPPHRYGIAALLGHHVMSILRNRAAGLHLRETDTVEVADGAGAWPAPAAAAAAAPPVDDSGMPCGSAYNDDVGAAATASSSREYAAPFDDLIFSAYDPFLTTAMMSSEGDLTGEGFADLFREMFGPGFGGPF